MKIRLISDTHHDHYNGANDTLFAALGADLDSDEVLVHAGDIAEPSYAEPCLAAYRRALPNTQMVFVLGNHDHADPQETPSSVMTIWHQAARKYNVTLLTPTSPSTVIDGRTIVGSTGWYAPTPVTSTQRWFDFEYSRITRAQVFAENTQFLEQVEALDPDIVISHMLPTRESIAVQYMGSLYNDFFFMGDATERLVDKLATRDRPLTWLHGHTHTYCNYKVGSVAVHCYPRGYPHERQLRNYVGQRIEL